MDTSRISDILRDPRVAPVAYGVVGGLTGGFVAGYFYGKRKNTITYYENIVYAEESPEEIPPFNANINDIKAVANDSQDQGVSEAPQEGGEVIRIGDPRPDPADIEVDQDPVVIDVPSSTEDSEDEMADPGGTVNVFDRVTEDWDYDTEIKRRESNHVYVIHVDEFFGRELDYDQNTLTYYNGDDIMADDQNTPVYGWQSIVGELKFGYGSNDRNVVYVRNEDRKCEYEILYDPGSFSTEVLGIYAEDATEEDEIRHSRSLLKFRLE